MENVGKLIQMEILTKQVKLDSLNKLVKSLDSLSRLANIESIAKSQVAVVETAKEEVDFRLTARVSKKVLEENKVAWLYRDAEMSSADSGWRVYSGTESDAFLEDDNNFVYLTLAELAERNKKLKEVLNSSIGVQFEWFDEFNKFVELA